MMLGSFDGIAPPTVKEAWAFIRPGLLCWRLLRDLTQIPVEADTASCRKRRIVLGYWCHSELPDHQSTGSQVIRRVGLSERLGETASEPVSRTSGLYSLLDCHPSDCAGGRRWRRVPFSTFPLISVSGHAMTLVMETDVDEL